MNRTLIVAALLLLTACGSLMTNTPEERGDQDQLILATLWYQKSAEMRALYYQCYRNASTALADNMKNINSQGPFAVILDIDETVLDNSPFQGWQVHEGKGFNDEDWTRWVRMAKAEALPGAAEFTRYADSLGVDVFYISNRAASERKPTIENLKSMGFADADSLHLLLKEETSSKTKRRAQLEEKYEIVLLVGDNLADMTPGFEVRGDDLGFGDVDREKELFGKKYIMLPNPMYGSWLSELLKKAPGTTEREKMLNMLQGF